MPERMINILYVNTHWPIQRSVLQATCNTFIKPAEVLSLQCQNTKMTRQPNVILEWTTSLDCLGL